MVIKRGRETVLQLDIRGIDQYLSEGVPLFVSELLLNMGLVEDRKSEKRK